jgi:hypothetical protein
MRPLLRRNNNLWSDIIDIGTASRRPFFAFVRGIGCNLSPVTALLAPAQPVRFEKRKKESQPLLEALKRDQ